MHASHRAPTALGLILAIPLFALPAFGAATHETAHKPTHHRVAVFAEARAYVSSAAPALRAPETDGLSRQDEECVFGCVDH